MSVYFNRLRESESAFKLCVICRLEVIRQKGCSPLHNKQALLIPSVASRLSGFLLLSARCFMDSTQLGLLRQKPPHSPWVQFSKYTKRKTLRRRVCDKSIVRALMPFSLYCPTQIGADALCVYCSFLTSPPLPLSSAVTSDAGQPGIPSPRSVHDPPGLHTLQHSVCLGSSVIRIPLCLHVCNI